MFIVYDGYIMGSTKELSGEVVIPEYYNGIHIVGIGEKAFYGMKGITSVILPNSVKSIGDYAFCKCTSLSNINFTPHMYLGMFAFSETWLRIVSMKRGTYIGTGCFSDCKNLKTVIIEDEITAIPDFCFSKCIKLEKLIIYSNIISIGEYAFEKCKIEDFNGPSVEKISNNAFYMCQNMRTAYFPNVKEIEVGAFAGCVRLDVKIGNKLERCQKAFGSVLHVECASPLLNPEGCFSLNKDCIFTEGFVLSKDKQTLIGFYGYKPIIHIPEGVKYIGPNAFAYAINIQKVYFPESLISVGAFAFYKCENLEFVIVNKGLKFITPGAFDESGIKQIIQPHFN